MIQTDSLTHDTLFFGPEADAAYVVEPLPSVSEGVVDACREDGIPLPVRPGYDSGVLTMILASFLVVAFSFKSGQRLWKTFFADLVSVRRRANVFDERTADENWVITAMLMQTCIYEGILLFTLMPWRQAADAIGVFAVVGLMVALSVGFYLFQYTGYQLVGYAFLDSTARSVWVRGFNASQSILGFTLIVPALGALFNPDDSSWLLWICAALYVIARLVFIFKGFRIFYRGIGTLFYFILYLCTLEIIPVLMVYLVAVSLCEIVK